MLSKISSICLSLVVSYGALTSSSALAGVFSGCGLMAAAEGIDPTMRPYVNLFGGSTIIAGGSLGTGLLITAGMSGVLTLPTILVGTGLITVGIDTKKGLEEGLANVLPEYITNSDRRHIASVIAAQLKETNVVKYSKEEVAKLLESGDYTEQEINGVAAILG